MSTLDPAKMDKEESARVAALHRAAKGRPHLTQARDSVSDDPHKHKSQRAYATEITLNGRVLGYSNAITAGDAVRKAIEKREEFQSMQGKPVQHVKDGKPLTAYGAKMLGVQWGGAV
jgi:hypothetical protein